MHHQSYAGYAPTNYRGVLNYSISCLCIFNLQNSPYQRINSIPSQGFYPCLWLLVIAKSFIFEVFPRVFLFHFREFQEKNYQKGIKILIL